MHKTRRTKTTRPDAAPLPSPTTAPAPAINRSSRLLRFETVRERTGLSRSTIWRLERRGLFPRHRQISLNAVGWLEDELDYWIATRRPRVWS